MRSILLSLVVSTAAIAQSDRCDEALATKQYAALAPAFRKYVSMPVNGMNEQLKRRLVAKVSEQRRLEQEYTRIAGLGCPRLAVDSLVMIGRLIDELAQKLRAIPLPAGLDPELAARFRRKLEEQSAPVDAKAREAFTAAVEKAKDLDVSSPELDHAKRWLASSPRPAEPPER